MKNSIFTAQQLTILLQPKNWMLITDSMSTPVVPADAEYHRWIADNSHSHLHREILFVLAGNGFHTLNGICYPISQGSIMIFDRLHQHDCSIPPWNPSCEHLWLILVQDYLIAHLITHENNTLSTTSSASILLSPAETGMAVDENLEAILHSNIPQDICELRLIAIVQLLISSLLLAGYRQREKNDKPSFQAEIIATVQQYIINTVGHRITLDALAQITGYNKYHFLRLFKRHSGYSVHEFIERCRIARMFELTNLGYNKTAIASTLGFSCLSAYSRWKKNIISANFVGESR